MVEVKTVQTDKAPAAIGPYSQAKIVGDLVFSSGQIPLDPASGEVVSNNVSEQTEQTIANVKAVLEAAGTSIDNVVKTTCFLADMGDFATFNEIYGKHFTSNPARSAVAVKTLPKNVLVEIEVIATV